ncbi:MAG: ABC transporter ATP-binding protein [Pseudomonadota bacterium]
MTKSGVLFEARNLGKAFVNEPGALEKGLARLSGGEATKQIVRAVDDVSFQLKEGETLGIVGESGCGKSTLGRIIAGLISPTSGEMTYRSRPMSDQLSKARDTLKIQMIFQDPMSSLNPRLKVVDIIGEAAKVHGITKRGDMRAYVAELIQTVGLDVEHLDRYPHQFSGGQRQRIGIARALAVKPELLICDEAVAALDVSVQAQIANLFMEIRDRAALSMIFISHDLSVIRHLCDRVLVMYLGRVVEIAPTADLFDHPRHPYTRMLLDAMPKISVEKRVFEPIRGEIPSPLNPPPGCTFHPRCSRADSVCHKANPPLETSGERAVRCYHPL